jgi:hypothetical protein
MPDCKHGWHGSLLPLPIRIAPSSVRQAFGVDFEPRSPVLRDRDWSCGTEAKGALWAHRWRPSVENAKAFLLRVSAATALAQKTQRPNKKTAVAGMGWPIRGTFHRQWNAKVLQQCDQFLTSLSDRSAFLTRKSTDGLYSKMMVILQMRLQSAWMA